MIKMRTIGYAFWAGALIYLVFALIIVLSLNFNIYIAEILSLATLFPVIFYLAKSPSDMPLKKVLWAFVLFSIYVSLLSIYQYCTWDSIGNSWTDQHAQYLRFICTAIFMILKLKIFGQIIKLSKRFSFVWWTCVLNFIVALEPIFTPFMVSAYFGYNYIQYMNLIYDFSFALLYISIGLFLIPKSN